MGSSLGGSRLKLLLAKQENLAARSAKAGSAEKGARVGRERK